MEALTISAANLDTIEKNLGAVANELVGVISNVSNVNNQVNKVEEKVADLNNDVKNLMQEIRETTIITNARQSIMYNNEQIEKRYGYYDQVRRTTESLIDAIENSNISIEALNNLKQNLILNNPNYWLSNALAALTCWILNDKENTNIEVANALKKDNQKTCIFFSLINLKLNRTQTSINWLNRYLSSQNPLKLDKNFVTILDLVTTGAYGNKAKENVLNKINQWFYQLNSENQIQEKQIDTWYKYITEHEIDNVTFNRLAIYSPNIATLKNNLLLTSSYTSIKNEISNIIDKEFSNKKIDEILSDLIYEYENKEQEYQKDNLRNRLIIECNGDRIKAEKLYQKQESTYNTRNDLLSLLTNIVINKELYKISNETKKFALSLIKEYILKAYDKKRIQINNEEITIKIDDFTTQTTDGENRNEIQKELEIYLNKKFIDEDKDLLIILILVNILGIIGIFITLNNKILSGILIGILILSNIILFYKLNKRSKLRTIEKSKTKKNIENTLERILAETIDYKNILKEDQLEYQALSNYLSTLEAKNYINSNGERNINIGE